MRNREELLAFIEGDAGLTTLLDRASGVLDDDPGHDLSHCLRVALWTVRLGVGRG